MNEPATIAAQGRKGSRGVPAKPDTSSTEQPKESKAQCSHIPPEGKFSAKEYIERVQEYC